MQQYRERYQNQPEDEKKFVEYGQKHYKIGKNALLKL